MTTDAVRSLIREVLAEELDRVRQERAAPKSVRANPSVVEEIVSLKSDQDLQALIQHVLKISRNKSMHDKIVRGDHVFRLDAPQVGSSSPKPSPIVSGGQGVVRIEGGFLSERQVENLPQGTRVVEIGQGVRFTPLARDRLRQRKIAVERID